MAKASRTLPNILGGANEPKNDDDYVFVLKMNLEYVFKNTDYYISANRKEDHGIRRRSVWAKTMMDAQRKPRKTGQSQTHHLSLTPPAIVHSHDLVFHGVNTDGN